MTKSLIDPPVSPDADLRDFAFMPLDVIRLRDSEFAISTSAEEFRAAVLLWCAAWHQIPAASLPNDDRVLASLAGFGRGAAALDAWNDVKEGALRGFVEASDGRLYHLVVASKAAEAWEEKCAFRKRKAEFAARQSQRAKARWQSKNQEDDTQDENLMQDADFDAGRNAGRIASGIDSVDAGRNAAVAMPMKGTGTGTGTGIINIYPSTEVDDASSKRKRWAYTESFEQFWSAYPRKVGKLAAFKAWKRSLAEIGSEDAPERILKACERFSQRTLGQDSQYIPHPATWLHAGRWDDIDTPATANRKPMGRDAFGVGG